MRIVFYNIRYGTGSDWNYHFPLPFWGFFRYSSARVNEIAEFLDSLHADIVCLVEVDGGSYRYNKCSQADFLASEEGWTYKFSGKYGTDSLFSRLPILSSQGNAILSQLPIHSCSEKKFSKGIKNTFLEVEFDEFHVILAHLSLGKRAREAQLKEIARYCKQLSKPVILGGDFNLIYGSSELKPLTKGTGFKDVDDKARPTFPSRMPTLRLDYMLIDGDIRIEKVDVPKTCLSDHLPLVCDFSIGGY